MSSKSIIVLAAAGIAVALAGPAFAKLNGTSVALSCSIASKEFAGPVEVKNTTRGTIAPGKKIVLIVKTAHGSESETITLAKALKPGATVKGNKVYEDTAGCTSSVFYPKPV